MNAMLQKPILDPSPLPLRLIGRWVPAGFPSPADDYLEGEIDLNRYLIERPAACYVMRVELDLELGRRVGIRAAPNDRVPARGEAAELPGPSERVGADEA